ncbi:MAG TPA: aminotransferase class IV [Actinoplanes sp.]|nr:aminotransferase class IV [Actinoplanes sp.]
MFSDGLFFRDGVLIGDGVLSRDGVFLGDGVFETVHLRPAGPWLLEQHLERLARSADLLDLPVPDLTAKIDETITGWSGDEAALRIVCRRDAPPSITVSPIPGTVLAERRRGVRVLTSDAGVSIHRPPWSLATAKTMSYAANLAARRWAAAHGADDMLWFSVEGFALEAPTASLVWLTGNRLCTVPPGEAAILPGITAAHLLSRAAEVGLEPAAEMITRDDLRRADAIWLASSLRGLAEVIALDGAQRARSRWTGRLLDLLGFLSADADQPG